MPKLGPALVNAHRGTFVLLAILPIAVFHYWLIFVLSGNPAWKISAMALTESCDSLFSWIVPLWDSMPRRYDRRSYYPTVVHARHILAVVWLSICVTILLSLLYMPAFVGTAVAAGKSDPAMAYRIRFVSRSAWLVFLLTVFSFSIHGIYVSRRDIGLNISVMALLTEYGAILWICALLAHRQLGDRWRDFKGPS